MSCGSSHSKGGGGKKVPKGSHLMPDGRVMKDSAHKQSKPKGKGKGSR